jgi:hypothetical protein
MLSRIAQAGEEKVLQVLSQEEDSSQATVSPNDSVKVRLSMKWQVTARGLSATWRRTVVSNFLITAS